MRTARRRPCRRVLADLDSDLAPFFKSFLRIDADDDEVRHPLLRRHGLLLEEEADRPVEDDIVHVRGHRLGRPDAGCHARVL